MEKTPKFGPFIAQTLGNRVEGYAWQAIVTAPRQGPLTQEPPPELPPQHGEWGFARSIHEKKKAEAPWEERTRANIGSISKPVTAVAVLKLMDQGRVDLRKPFFSYLESRLKIEPGSGIRTVSVADLLAMKSCLQKDEKYEKLDPPPGQDIWTFLAEYLKKDIQKGCKPGERYEYLNINYTILQAVVIACSVEKDYPWCVRRSVLLPMGINLEDFDPRPDEKDVATLCYRDLSDTSAGYWWPEVQFVAAGGWIASPHAVRQFLEGVRGRKVLLDSTTELMFDQGYGWNALEGVFGRYYDFVGRLLNDEAGLRQGVMATVTLFGKARDADLAVLLTNSEVDPDMNLAPDDLRTLMVSAYEAPVPLSWSKPVETGAHSNDGPALCVFKNRLWMAYRRDSGTIGVRNSGDGKNWGEVKEIGGNPQPKTSKAPVLAVLKKEEIEELWVAYRGETHTDLYVTGSGDGVKWQKQTKISDQNGARSREGPALVEFKGMLRLAFIPEGGTQIYICTSFEGSNWYTPTPAALKAGTGSPSLVVYDGRLYLGALQASTLSVVSSEDGINWGTPILVSEQVTSFGHTLAVFRNRLCAVFEHSQSNLSISVSEEGKWSRFSISWLNGATAKAMASAPCDNRLFLATQGERTLSVCSFGGYLWKPPDLVHRGEPAGCSSKGPALTAFGSLMLMAFRDLEGWIATAELAWKTGWSKSTRLEWKTSQSPAKTSQSPALAVFRGLLYLAFVDERDSTLKLTNSADGKQWTTPVSISGAMSSQGPALASFRNQLWIAYRGKDKTTLYVHASRDGKNWSDKPPKQETHSRPALAVFNDRLWLAFRSGDTNLKVSSYDGSEWKSTDVSKQNEAKTKEGPALAAFGGELFLAYRGVEKEIRLCTSSDGEQWSPRAFLDPKKALSAESPALAAYWGELFLVWRSDASNANQRFSWSRLGLSHFQVLVPAS